LFHEEEMQQVLQDVRQVPKMQSVHSVMGQKQALQR
jgi:hypothetical protein